MRTKVADIEWRCGWRIWSGGPRGGQADIGADMGWRTLGGLKVADLEDKPIGKWTVMLGLGLGLMLQNVGLGLGLEALALTTSQSL